MSEPAHILVVEDEKDISEVLQIQLNRAGYKVSIINNGQQALDFIQQTKEKDSRAQAALPDLYLLDRMLPNVSGLDICKFLRHYNATQKAPFYW